MVSKWFNYLGKTKPIYTIGHSNRSFNDFMNLLMRNNVNVLVDIRRYPHSKLAWFSRDNLSKLSSYGVKYYSFPELGALGIAKYVKPLQDINCTSSLTYRSYITHILTSLNAKFRIKEIINMVNNDLSVCLMCCEKLPWRCHRRFLSDYFKAFRYDVIHIIDFNRVIIHKGTRCYNYIKDKIPIAN